MAQEVFMVYHPAGVPSNVVGIQSGTHELCSQQLERWIRKEGSDVRDLGRFSSLNKAEEFIRQSGYRKL